MLSPEQARRFYDRFGIKQDTQSFYENPALDKLVGGCRPIEVSSFISEHQWAILNNQIVVSWGVPSDVLVARCLK